jgi:hypothetical protein|tara:strand:- start:797 stop:988 length:192 start_codon:yes stop_codon:yes gene_type:complete
MENTNFNIMEDLNEAIGCYIDELSDLERNDKLSVSDKVKALNDIGASLSNESLSQWQYKEANP